MAQKKAKLDGMQPRKKNLPLHAYVDPKYADTVLYIRHTCGITKGMEDCLAKTKVDPDLLESIKRLEEMKKTAK
jgi:hypothetical protein